jgi:hypothetical protein
VSGRRNLRLDAARAVLPSERVQLTRRLAWLGLALLEDGEDEARQPVAIEVHAETVQPQPVGPKTLPPVPGLSVVATQPPPAEQGPAPAEQHLRSASRAYAASQLKANVEKLTGETAPTRDRPSRRPPLASA